ncbi:MAG: DUF1822 family protein [Cyanobacteria bacterium P01_A01_bin.114]
MPSSTHPVTNVTIALPDQAHQRADRFCQQQSDLKKAEQIYFNTLTVWGVHHYLETHGWDAHFGDSEDPVFQTCLNVADLSIPSLGRLECRPVLPGEQQALVPAETWHNRIGYVVAQLDEALETLTLLGFVKRVTAEALAFSQLRSPHELLPYLQQLKRETQPAPIDWSTEATRLGDWFQDQIEAVWQTLESLTLPRVPAYRSAPEVASTAPDPSTSIDTLPLRISRGKLLDLQPAADPVALIVEAAPLSETSDMMIAVKICPAGEQAYLPETLELIIRDQAGQAVITALACGTGMITAEFSGTPDERFSAEVSIDDRRVAEYFVI